jgi:16S rRNA (guanine527-N7)-methyltransferase
MHRRSNNADHAGAVKVPIEDVLDLHTFAPRDLPSLLEEYLTACQEARLYSVRIIHGKGQGFLKNQVRSLLGKLPMVASFSDAPAHGGGWGATVVELKRQPPTTSPDWTDFTERVEQGARAMDLHLELCHTSQFVLHAKELVQWNRFANLTAISDLQEMAEKQFLDTVPLVPLIPQASQVLDIGSGGGFPGVPLKVLRPDLCVHLIEASRKKTHFLKHLIRTLGLQDIEARHIRAEALAQEVQEEATRYDVVVSKAVTQLHRLVDQALPLLQKPGMVIAMKGIDLEDELAHARSKIRRHALSLETRVYALPFVGIKRSLIILRTR